MSLSGLRVSKQGLSGSGQILWKIRELGMHRFSTDTDTDNQASMLSTSTQLNDTWGIAPTIWNAARKETSQKMLSEIRNVENVQSHLKSFF